MWLFSLWWTDIVIEQDSYHSIVVYILEWFVLLQKFFSVIYPPVVLVSDQIVISYIILCYYSIMQVLLSRVVLLFTYMFKSFVLFTF